MFKLRLYIFGLGCSDFSFSLKIRCLDFINIIVASIAVQKFRFCLLQIRCSNFTFIWIRCSYFIYITFSTLQFRLCLLQIGHLDFAFLFVHLRSDIQVLSISCLHLSSNIEISSSYVMVAPGHSLLFISW